MLDLRSPTREGRYHAGVSNRGTVLLMLGRGSTPSSDLPRWFDLMFHIAGRVLVIAAAGAVVVWVGSILYLVTVPVLLALLLAAVATPPVERLQRRGLSRSAAAASVYLIAVVGAGGVGAFVTRSFTSQVRELGPKLQKGWDSLLTWLADGPFSFEQDRVSEAVTGLFSSGGPFSAGRIIGGAGEVVAGLILALVLSFFFVKDGPLLARWLTGLFPEGQRGTAVAVGQRMWMSLGGFMRGTALVAAIDAVGIAVGLAIIGVPAILPLVVLVFLGGFIPVLGATITGLLAVLVAFAWGGVGSAAAVAVVVLVVQQVESNVLQPMIMRRSVALHPVVVLCALTAGASLAGIIGALIAVPIAAALAAAGNELRSRHDSSGGSTEPAGTDDRAPGQSI
jgi:putative heme transporter